MPLKTKKHISHNQKEILVSFMIAHKELSMGKSSGTYPKKTTDELYEELAKVLNSVNGGAIKDSAAWKKTWHDYRRATIEKELERRQHLKEGKDIITLNDVQRRLIDNLVPKETFENQGTSDIVLEKKNDVIVNDMFEDYEKTLLHNLDEAERKRKRNNFNLFLQQNQIKQEVGDEEENGQGENDIDDEEDDEDRHLKMKEKSALELLQEKVDLKRIEIKLKRKRMDLEEKRHREVIECLQNIAKEIKNLK